MSVRNFPTSAHISLPHYSRSFLTRFAPPRRATRIAVIDLSGLEESAQRARVQCALLPRSGGVVSVQSFARITGDKYAALLALAMAGYVTQVCV